MTVDNVRLFNRPDHNHVSVECIQQLLVTGILKWDILTVRYPYHLNVFSCFLLVSKAKNLKKVVAAVQLG